VVERTISRTARDVPIDVDPIFSFAEAVK